jgi:hypothetical protein
MADEEKDVSRFFTNSGRMVLLAQRVNVDFTAPMLEELDRQAQELNVRRQAVIKTLLRQGIDQHYASTASREVNRNRTAPRDSSASRTVISAFWSSSRAHSAR